MATSEDNASRWRVALYVLLLFASGFRILYCATLPLSGDESYHWEWSRHLAFGYYDHPPLTAFIIRLFTTLLGASTELSVRLGAVLFLAGTVLVCADLARRITRDRGEDAATIERAGFLAGFLVLVVPVFAFFSLYMSTDPPLIFFWALSLSLAYRAFRTSAWGPWVALGAALGLALNAKLLAVFLVGGLGLHVLLTHDGRRWFSRPQPYAASACAVAVLAPFLLWNATHGWATFMFNFVYRQKTRGLHLEHVPEFVAGQMLALSPLVLVFAVLGLRQAIPRKGRGPDGALGLLGLSTAVPLAYFLAVSTVRQVGLHWPAAGWLGALVALAIAWAPKEPWSGGRRLRIATLALCIVLTAAAHVAFHVPPRWLRSDWAYPGDSERIRIGKHAERFGWEALGQRVHETREELLSRPACRGVFILGQKYGLASNVAFYTPGQPFTHLWSRRKTHGENYRFWDDFSSMKGQDALYVCKYLSGHSLQKLESHFDRVDEPETVPIAIQGQEVRRFYLVRCFGFDGETPDFARFPKQ